MGQHDRLGHPGGARGVEEGRPVFRAEGVHPGFEGGVGDGAPAGDELVPGHHAVGGHRGVVHHHDPAQVGHPGTLGEDAVQPLLVLHQDHGGFGVVDDVGRTRRRCSSGRSRPASPRPPWRRRRRWSIRAGWSRRCTPPARVHAEGEQTLGGGAHPGHVLDPGGGGPAAPVVDGVGDNRAPLGTGPQGPVDNAVEPHGPSPCSRACADRIRVRRRLGRRNGGSCRQVPAPGAPSGPGGSWMLAGDRHPTRARIQFVTDYAVITASRHGSPCPHRW